MPDSANERLDRLMKVAKNWGNVLRGPGRQNLQADVVTMLCHFAAALEDRQEAGPLTKGLTTADGYWDKFGHRMGQVEVGPAPILWPGPVKNGETMVATHAGECGAEARLEPKVVTVRPGDTLRLEVEASGPETFEIHCKQPEPQPEVFEGTAWAYPDGLADLSCGRLVSTPLMPRRLFDHGLVRVRYRIEVLPP